MKHNCTDIYLPSGLLVSATGRTLCKSFPHRKCYHSTQCASLERQTTTKMLEADQMAIFASQNCLDNAAAWQGSWGVSVNLFCKRNWQQRIHHYTDGCFSARQESAKLSYWLCLGCEQCIASHMHIAFGSNPTDLTLFPLTAAWF